MEKIEMRVVDVGAIESGHLDREEDLLLYSFIGDIRIEDKNCNYINIDDVPIMGFLSSVWTAIPIMMLFEAEIRMDQTFRQATTTLKVDRNTLIVRHAEEWRDNLHQEVRFESIGSFTKAVGEMASSIYGVISDLCPKGMPSVPILSAIQLIKASSSSKYITV